MLLGLLATLSRGVTQHVEQELTTYGVGFVHTLRVESIHRFVHTVEVHLLVIGGCATQTGRNVERGDEHASSAYGYL